MSVRIHIDRLVLDGFPVTAGQAKQLQAAVEHELSRLLGSSHSTELNSTSQKRSDPSSRSEQLPPLLLQGGHVPSAAAGPFNPPQGVTPAQLGRHIAQSVHGGMHRSK